MKINRLALAVTFLYGVSLTLVGSSITWMVIISCQKTGVPRNFGDFPNHHDWIAICILGFWIIAALLFAAAALLEKIA